MARPLSRIVVALDASAESRSVLQEAVALAARLRTEIAGLFVEDATLLSAARLTFIRQVSLNGHTVEAVDAVSMERTLRGQANTVRAALERAAAYHNLDWSFRVARGKASVQILAAALEADLVVMGKTTPAVTRRAGLGATARIIAAAPRGAILFAEPRLRRVVSGTGAVIALYDGSAASRDALALAIRIAAVSAGGLTIVTPAESADAGKALQAEAAGQLGPAAARARFRTCAGTGCTAIAHALAGLRGGLLAIGAGSPLLGNDPLADLIERLDSPVLVVAGDRL